MIKTAAANALITSYDWVEYFYQNAPEPIFPWNSEIRLSGAEKLAVLASIQQFQLGEGATGARMLERAKDFSRRTGDLGIVAALRLFLHEEQRHSQILARFLVLENVPCLRSHWIDSVFRKVRGLAGLELCLKVLVTAELLAKPYYAALRDATGSPLLIKICERIICEEAEHLRFQSFLLGRFVAMHGSRTQALIKALHGLLLAATASLVWVEHKLVFRAAGRTFQRFWQDAWQEFEGLYSALSH